MNGNNNDSHDTTTSNKIINNMVSKADEDVLNQLSDNITQSPSVARYWFLQYDRNCFTLNVKNLTSDTAFSEIIFDCWRTRKIFSCQHLDLNLSQ